MFRRLKERLKDERGMTLVELLTAEMIGGIVITAAIMLVVISFNGSQRVSDRVNSLAQGRILAAQLDQRISSQVCLYSGEYAVNGTTVYTGAADSIVFAGPDKLIFFADINKGGSTAATSSVGFTPYMRFLFFDPGPSGPTTGLNAVGGRLGSFIDGYRAPSNSAVPFSYDLTPLTGALALEDMGASSTTANKVVPTSQRKIVIGVTNDVTGVAATAVPFFQYWTVPGPTQGEQPITIAAGAVPTAQLGDIGHIRVNFRILAESGNDKGKGNTNNDIRTASFNSDTYLRTNPSICG
jgi:type II secretory pathway pseudopilin PulG